MADDPRFDIVYNNDTVGVAAFSQRWAALTKLDVDIDTIRTWDRRLPRDKRILVPVDVQAYVVPTAGAEATVAIAGGASDPEPFAAGAAPPSGVHLHWAMPDALMRGSHVEGATSITMPALPDRWVVVRTLLPVGGRLVHTRGWVVDAVKGSVTPLTDYSGTTVDAADGVQPYSPLDGTSGGTLLWSATYEGARNRFALHDDLADVPKLETVAPQGFHAGRAVLHRRRVVVDRGERSARLGPQPARVAGAGGRLRLAHLTRGTRRRRHARRSTAHPAAGDLGAVEPEVDHAGAPVRQVLGALHRLLRDRPARGLPRRRGLGPLHRRRLDAVPLVAARQRARRADHGRADRRRRSTGERGDLDGDRPRSRRCDRGVGHTRLRGVAVATPVGRTADGRVHLGNAGAHHHPGWHPRHRRARARRRVLVVRRRAARQGGRRPVARRGLAAVQPDDRRTEGPRRHGDDPEDQGGRGPLGVRGGLGGQVLRQVRACRLRFVEAIEALARRRFGRRPAEHTRAVTDGRQAGAKAVPAGTADRRGARGQAERPPPRRRAVRPPGAAVPLAGRVPTGLPGRARPGADPADTRQRGDPRRGTDGRARGRHARSLFGPVAGPGRPARNAVEGPRRAHRGRTRPPLWRRDDLRRIRAPRGS